MQKPKDQHAFIFPNSKHQTQGLPPADKHATTSCIPVFVLFEKKSYYLFCMYTHVCMTSIQVPSEARRGCQMTGSWSSSWLLAPWRGCWEPNWVLWQNTKSTFNCWAFSLALHLFFSRSYCVVQASLHLRIAHLSFWSSRLTDTHHAQLSNIELLFTVAKAHLRFCVFCYNSCIK